MVTSISASRFASTCFAILRKIAARFSGDVAPKVAFVAAAFSMIELISPVVCSVKLSPNGVPVVGSIPWKVALMPKAYNPTLDPVSNFYSIAEANCDAYRLK